MSGKFANKIDEALYELSLDGCYPDDGDVQSPSGWFCAIDVYFEHEVIPRGYYLIVEDVQGLVDSEFYDNAKARDRSYAARSRTYAEWVGEDG